MRTRTLRDRAFLMALLIVGVIGFPRPGLSQTVMSFSYYTDFVLSGDGSTFFTVVDGYDNSSGCQHTNYESYGSLYAPSGFYDNYFGGLSVSFNVPADDGDFTIESSSTVLCNCVGPLDAGGAEPQTGRIRPYTARMAYDEAGSSPEPHTSTSTDRYENAFCSGFCQPGFVTYTHGQGMGHLFLEIKGQDVETPYSRTCKGVAVPKTTFPQCVPS